MPTHAPTFLRLIATGALAGVTLALATSVSTTPAVAAGAESYPCRSFGSFPAYNPYTSARQDLFTWPAGRTAKVGNGRHDINWRLNPYRDDSWRTWFHGLMWAGSLVEKSTRGWTKDRDPAAIDGAVAIARDWVRDNPAPWPTGPGAGNATHTRTDFLLCLRAGLQQVGRPVPSWLDSSLLQHAAWLRGHTWKDHNVGTEQTLAVLGVGCVLDRRDLRDYAAGKLSGDISRVIDAQGANNEQSVGYARWNWDLWGDVEKALDTCHITTPAARTITARRAGLETFLDHATTPEGVLAPIGDTQVERAETGSPAQRWIATDGREGRPPRDRVKVYSAGYVFGRSGWGGAGRPPAQESMYALHFGATRVGHGHNDHTSFTWNAGGRPVLTEAGTGSYTNGPWREHYTGPTAHNQLVMPRMRTSQTTRLTRSVPGAAADYYQLADAPINGASRVRDVLFLHDPDIVVTLDRAAASTPTTFTQTWHLPYTDTARLTRGGATSTAARGAGTTTFLRLPVPGAATPRLGLVRGAPSPLQGWQWLDYYVKRPAPVVTATTSGRSTAIATAVVAAAPRDAVSVTSAPSGRSMTHTFRVGSATAVVAIARDGRMTRLR